MNNLIKVDLFRLKKDKTALLGGIISFGLLMMSVGLFAVISSFAENMDGLQQLFSAKTGFIQSFQMGNNVGLVVIIIIAIMTSRDFTQHTIRLKVINGYDRVKIYFSTLITNLIYGILLIVVYALLNLSFMSMIFGFGEALTTALVLELLGGMSMALLHVVLFISIATAISMKFQTIGASIGLSIAIIIGEGLLSSILLAFPLFIGNFPEWLSYAMKVFPSQGMTWLIGFNYDMASTIIVVISSLVLIVLTNALAVMTFRKNDLK